MASASVGLKRRLRGQAFGETELSRVAVAGVVVHVEGCEIERQLAGDMRAVDDRREFHARACGP